MSAGLFRSRQFGRMAESSIRRAANIQRNSICCAQRSIQIGTVGSYQRVKASTSLMSGRTFATSASMCKEISKEAAVGEKPSNPLTDREYSDVSEHTLNTLTDTIEDTLVAVDFDIDSYEIEYSMGVLTLKLPYGTYVINKQPPNKEIWLSSPLSGPKRFQYDYDHDQWAYPRTGDVLETLLETEFTQNLKITFNLPPQGFKTFKKQHH